MNKTIISSTLVALMVSFAASCYESSDSNDSGTNNGSQITDAYSEGDADEKTNKNAQNTDANSEGDASHNTDNEYIFDLNTVILQRQMKGWELYAWTDDDGVSFTLMAGTNRTKTREEITSDLDILDVDTGWTKIKVDDIDDLETLLSKVPEGDTVVWRGCGFERCEPVSKETESKILGMIEERNISA
jgi:hypothetical protein